MNKQKTRNHHCPTHTQLELLCLESGLAEDDQKRSQMHLQQCMSCRNVVEELDSFYSTLLQEVFKPVSNQVLDFAKEIGRDDVEYGYILCEPIPERNNGRGFAFRTNVLFFANGEPGKGKLAQFNKRKIPHDCIALRAMTDPEYKTLLLFLVAPSDSHFDDWVLNIPGTAENVKFSPIGVSKIPLSSVKTFDDKVIFLKTGVDSEPDWLDSRLQRIKEATRF